ncbi:MAG: ParB/RepB/Spo0J family partition protein, partial [Rhabdochlamydiaceae bacterium]
MFQPENNLPVPMANANSKEPLTETAFLPVNLLKTSRYQTRDAAFDNYEELENLANSIKTVGLLEFPRVRKDPEHPDSFEIISGHRRIRAVSKFLGWKEIECEILERQDEFDVFRLNVAENVQRSNLSSYEEGMAYVVCQKLFGLSDDEMANQLHKSRQTVANKRELAVAANHYAEYTDSSVSNAFLRHFSIGHKEMLSKLTDAQMIKHSVTMIARGGSVKHIRRFVQLFANDGGKQRTANHLTDHVHSTSKLNSVEEVLSMFEELKKEVPKKYVDRISKLEDKY